MTVKEGIILKGIGGFYYVKSGDTVYECKARGIFRKRGQKPLAGDRVTIEITDESCTIVEIGERDNSLIRPPIANVERLFVVVSAKDPSPNVLVLDKMLAVAVDKGIEPIVIFTKTDLADISELKEIYTSAGFTVLTTSVDFDKDLDRLKGLLCGKISAFAGNTGVGKSTLLNRLSDKFSQETTEISKKLGRGRHTTRSVELLEIEDGYVADTPGFSTVDIERYEMVSKENLPYAFIEFAPYLGKCKFQSCAHIGEKGCAVCEAVANGEISKSRHDSYVAMHNEVKDIKEWQKK